MFLHTVSDLEERIAHLYAECLCFIAARNSTAVIVGKHNDGPALQIRAEDPLAGSEEIVAVGKSEHTYIFFIT